MQMIPLTGKYANGAVCLVDDDIYEIIKGVKWRLNEKGYAVRSTELDGKMTVIKLHRFIMDAPPRQEVDHRDGNKLDCRRENLRFATHDENNRNRRGKEN